MMPTPEEARHSAENGETPYERGVKAERTEARFREIEGRLMHLDGANSEGVKEIRSLREEIRAVSTAFTTATAVAVARADDLKKAAEGQVSTRTFIVSLIVVAVMLAALIVGVSVR